MRNVRDLSYHDLERIVTSTQGFLYIDLDEQGREIWDPDKEWSGADFCEHVAHLLSQHDLVPDRPELLTGERNQYILGPIDGHMLRKQQGVPDETPSCDCQQPGHFYSGIPGILAHVENARLDKTSKVERCDQCQRYPTDQAALDKLVELGIAEDENPIMSPR